MTADIIPLPSAEHSAWLAYCEAARKAQETLDIADAIAAGRAWSRWLRLFEPRQ